VFDLTLWLFRFGELGTGKQGIGYSWEPVAYFFRSGFVGVQSGSFGALLHYNPLSDSRATGNLARYLLTGLTTTSNYFVQVDSSIASAIPPVTQICVGYITTVIVTSTSGARQHEIFESTTNWTVPQLTECTAPDSIHSQEDTVCRAKIFQLRHQAKPTPPAGPESMLPPQFWCVFIIHID